jgi:polyribonucleotide nucleotidyltransferase
MGSVCASTLALMDVCVPFNPSVISKNGLLVLGDEVRILTDIQAIEDFLGVEDGLQSMALTPMIGLRFGKWT